MDLTVFWKQVFYPLDNFIQLLFVTLITASTGWIMRELEGLEFFNQKRYWYKKVASFLLRFFLAFFISITIVFVFILIISLILGLVGFLIIK